jgi:hypothetical protein
VLTVEDRPVLPFQGAGQVIPRAAARIPVGRNHRQIGKRVQDAVEGTLSEDDRPIDLPDRRFDRDAAKVLVTHEVTVERLSDGDRFELGRIRAQCRKGDQIIQGAIPAEDVVRSQMLDDHLGGQLVNAVAELRPSVAQTFPDRLQPDQMDAAGRGVRVAGEQPRQFGSQDWRGLGSGLGSGGQRRSTRQLGNG